MAVPEGAELLGAGDLLAAATTDFKSASRLHRRQNWLIIYFVGLGVRT